MKKKRILNIHWLSLHHLNSIASTFNVVIFEQKMIIIRQAWEALLRAQTKHAWIFTYDVRIIRWIEAVTPKGMTSLIRISACFSKRLSLPQEYLVFCEWIIYEQMSKYTSEKRRETKNRRVVDWKLRCEKSNNIRILWHSHATSKTMHAELRGIDSTSRTYQHTFASEPEKYYHLVIVVPWIHLPLFAVYKAVNDDKNSKQIYGLQLDYCCLTSHTTYHFSSNSPILLHSLNILVNNSI